MQDKPFALIGVNSDDLADAIKAVEENKLNWRSFQNDQGEEGKISQTWSVRGWPTIVVLDQDFTIRYRGHSGQQATEIAKDLVAALTGEEVVEEVKKGGD